MTGTTEGCNPTLRPQVGVGWNRALPSSFGFDNGFDAKGSGYFSVPNLAGKPMPSAFTIEFWYQPPHSGNENCIFGIGSPSLNFSCDFYNGGLRLRWPNPGDFGAVPANTRNHMVMIFSGSPNISWYLNGGTSKGGTQGSNNSVSYPFATENLSYFYVGSTPNSAGVINTPIDEFRIYKNALSLSDIVTNYNNGIGANPSITENLIGWYSFQKFENVDLSALQDGSNVKLGVKDRSGKFNHCVPSAGLITDPANASYCLQPF